MSKAALINPLRRWLCTADPIPARGLGNNLMVAVQTSTTPEALTSAIREQVRGLDPDQPLTNINTMDQFKPDAFGAKFSLLLFGLLAAWLWRWRR